MEHLRGIQRIPVFLVERGKLCAHNVQWFTQSLLSTSFPVTPSPFVTARIRVKCCKNWVLQTAEDELQRVSRLHIFTNRFPNILYKARGFAAAGVANVRGLCSLL